MPATPQEMFDTVFTPHRLRGIANDLDGQTQATACRLWDICELAETRSANDLNQLTDALVRAVLLILCKRKDMPIEEVLSRACQFQDRLRTCLSRLDTAPGGVTVSLQTGFSP